MARRRRIPGQLVRLGILFVLLVATLVYVRNKFLPPTFGELGHYRAAAIEGVASQPIQFAGMDACAECHDPHDPTPPVVPSECAACHGAIARTKACRITGRSTARRATPR